MDINKMKKKFQDWGFYFFFVAKCKKCKNKIKCKKMQKLQKMKNENK